MVALRAAGPLVLSQIRRGGRLSKYERGGDVVSRPRFYDPPLAAGAHPTPATYNSLASSVNTSHPSSVIAIVSLNPTPNLRGHPEHDRQVESHPRLQHLVIPLRNERRPVRPGRRKPPPRHCTRRSP